MPQCVSCRGEYPEKPSTSQGSPSSTVKSYICPRCGENNKGWDGWLNKNFIFHLIGFFLNFWGCLTFGSLILLIIAFLYLISDIPGLIASFQNVLGKTNFFALNGYKTTLIGLPLAVALILACLMLIYALKESLWRYDLLARVTLGFRPTLVLLAVISFVLAMLFGTGSIFMVRASVPTPTPTLTGTSDGRYVTPIPITPPPIPTTPVPIPTTPVPPPTSTPIPCPTKNPCRPHFHGCCW